MRASGRAIFWSVLLATALLLTGASFALEGDCETCFQGLCIPVDEEWGFQSCNEVTECHTVIYGDTPHEVCQDVCQLGSACLIPPPW